MKINKYSDHTKQELRFLIARHGDTKRKLESELFEIQDNLYQMYQALKDKVVESE